MQVLTILTFFNLFISIGNIRTNQNRIKVNCGLCWRTRLQLVFMQFVTNSVSLHTLNQAKFESEGGVNFSTRIKGLLVTYKISDNKELL